MKNILVGIDFQERPERLIKKSFNFFKYFKPKIWLLHAAAPHPDFVGYEVGPQYIRDFRAKELTEEHKKLISYANMLENKGADVEGLLIQGATIDVILEESKKLNIDLIVFGYHERSFFYNIFFESKAVEVVKKSEIPVLVIPIN